MNVNAELPACSARLLSSWIPLDGILLYVCSIFFFRTQCVIFFTFDFALLLEMVLHLSGLSTLELGLPARLSL